MSRYQLFYGADYLLFDAVTKKPHTTRELSQMFQISEQTVSKHMKRFAECTPPLVVKRWPDRVWVPMVVLRVERPSETVEIATGVPMPTEARPQEQETVQAMPDATLPPPAPKPYVPPAPQEPVSDRAQKIAERMRVPANLIEYGEVSLGKLAQCVRACGRTSVLKYGGVNVCPMCARGGR